MAMSEEMLAKISPDTRLKLEVKAEYMAKCFYIVCPDYNTMRECLDALSIIDWEWHDPTFNEDRPLHVRRHKNLQQRELGRFRSHFYKAVKNRFDQIEALKDSYTLKIIKGTLCIEVDNDALPLIHFSRTLITDRSGFDVDLNIFSKYGILEPEVNTIIEVALDEAEDDLE